MANRQRNKGAGHIFKRNGMYYLQYDVNGKRKKISLNTRTQREAEKKAESLLKPAREANSKEKVALHIAEARNIIQNNSLLITETWEAYVNDSGRPDSGPATLKRYGQYWQRFVKWLEENYPSIDRLSHINKENAIGYGNMIWATGLSGKTFNAHFQALKLVFKVLARQTDIVGNPFNAVAKKSENKISRKEFSEDEIMSLFEVFKDSSFSLMNKDEIEIMFHLATWTGLRLIDCALMQWDYINMHSGRISCVPIKTKKTGKRVIIPIHPLLNKALKKAQKWENKNSKYVLPKTAERYKRNPFGVQEDTAKVIKHAGFETTKDIEGERRIRKINVYGFHSLRHSFVSFCAKYGVPLAVVQSIVGHGNPAMTRHYVHIGDEAVKQAINALPQGKHLLDDTALEKTDSQKIKEAIALLNSKPKLIKTDKQLLKILQ